MRHLRPIWVVQIGVDFIKQRVFMKEPKPRASQLSSARLSDASLMQIMSDPKWRFGRLGLDPKQLQRTDTDLNLPAAVLNKIQVSRRKRCDICVLLHSAIKCEAVPGKDESNAYDAGQRDEESVFGDEHYGEGSYRDGGWRES
jgi:hypothetical protein